MTNAPSAPQNPALPPVPRSRSAYRYWTREKVRFSEVDAVGHANNNAIGVYFETSRVEMLREMGILQTSREVQCVLAKMSLEFIRELAMFDQIEIADAVARIGTSSFTLHSAIFVPRGEEMICAATCEAVCVLVDAQTHRPTPIAPDARAVLEKYTLS